MKPFSYERADDVVGALRAVARRPGAKFLAGGTNLILGMCPPSTATPAPAMPVPMPAPGAKVETVSADGAGRPMPLNDRHASPGEHPGVEPVLQPGELITAVVLPPPPAGGQAYRK